MSHLYTKFIGESLDDQLISHYPQITTINKYRHAPGCNANWHTEALPDETFDALIDRHLVELEDAHETLTNSGVNRRVLYTTVTDSLQGNFELSTEQVRRVAALGAALAVTVVHAKRAPRPPDRQR